MRRTRQHEHYSQCDCTSGSVRRDGCDHARRIARVLARPILDADARQVWAEGRIVTTYRVSWREISERRATVTADSIAEAVAMIEEGEVIGEEYDGGVGFVTHIAPVEEGES